MRKDLSVPVLGQEDESLFRGICDKEFCKRSRDKISNDPALDEERRSKIYNLPCIYLMLQTPTVDFFPSMQSEHRE